LLLDGEQNVLRRETFGLEEVGTEIDHDLALFSAVRKRNNGAGNSDELRAEEILAEVVELLLGEAFAGEAELQDRDAGGAVIDDQRRKRARWQLPKNGLRDGGDLGVGVFQAGIGLKKDFDYGLAVYGGGFDVLDVIDGGGEDALVDGGDTAFEFFGVEAGILPGYGDDRNIDVGEDVRGRAHEHDGAQQEDEQS